MTLNPARILRRLACLLACALLMLLASCGEDSGPQAGGPESSSALPGAPPTTSSTSLANTTTSLPGGSSLGWNTPSEDLRLVFQQLAAQDLGFTLLVPSELPVGARLAPGWRPLDREPGAQLQANPHLVGPEGEKELRLLIQTDQGWIEIIEGMRGDLGDLPHERVSLGDHGAAALYKVRDGQLVQWSRDGVWYAVFGLGTSAEDVTRVARGMLPAS